MSMSEEGVFFQKISSYLLTNVDYEDPSRVFPIKEDERKLMRTCRRCWVLHDINSVGECKFHSSFYRLTVSRNRVGLIIGKKGKNVKEIRKRSKVSNITAVNDKEGKFTGEIQLQGGGEEVDQASSLIRQQLMGRGSIDGSWACCNAKRTKAKGCDVETNHDSAIQWSFLDRSKVVTTHSLTGEEPGPGKVFALDCEMVETTRGKEVARVTLIDFEGHDCI